MSEKSVDKADWEALVESYAGVRTIHLDIEFGEVIDRCRSQLSYLATPYSKLAVDLDGQFCHVRSDFAGQEAAKWLAHCGVNGITAVSPIVQSVAMLGADPVRALNPLDERFWSAWCAPMLWACSAVIIPQIDGWSQSAGVLFEAHSALKAMKPVFVIKKGSEYGGGL